MDIENAKTLISYCGLFCGSCGIYKGRIIAMLAKDLKELIEAYNYPEWVPEYGGIDFNFNEFLKGLEYFIKDNSKCYGQVSCIKGCGMPGCKIKECAKKRSVELCFECDDFPCDNFLQFGKEWRTIMTKEHDILKKLGKDEWIKMHIQQAEKGYCNATKKYYSKGKVE